MVEIPEDIREKASRLFYEADNSWLPEGAMLIARALLAEREAATKIERERVAKIAKETARQLRLRFVGKSGAASAIDEGLAKASQCEDLVAAIRGQ